MDQKSGGWCHCLLMFDLFLECEQHVPSYPILALDWNYFYRA